MKENPIIKVADLVYSYGDHRVLKNINMTVYAGEFVAIIGENGAGKSTLTRHFNGLLKPLSGRVEIAGQETKRCKVSELAHQVGYVFQNPDHQLFHNTVAKEVAFGVKNLGLSIEIIQERVDEALQAVGLEEYRDSYPYDLSKGQRQRVALAAVLAMQPEVIVLDEPTTGQDYREMMQIMAIIQGLNQKGHTIIFITHDMALVAEFAKRVIVLGEGQILQDDSVRAVFTCPDVLKQSFLELPHVTQLGNRLSHPQISSPLLTVDEAYETLKPLVGGEAIG